MKNYLILILLVIATACASSQKRNVAQLANICADKKPAVGEWLIFKEKQKINAEKALGKQKDSKSWMNLIAGASGDIKTAELFEIVGFGCTEKNLPYCGDVNFKSLDTGRIYWANCGGTCSAEDYALFFQTPEDCDKNTLVPASAPEAPHTENNAPTEI